MIRKPLRESHSRPEGNFVMPNKLRARAFAPDSIAGPEDSKVGAMAAEPRGGSGCDEIFKNFAKNM
jgi:hypothetical protein